MQLISAIDLSAIYAKVGEQYLYDNAGTLTGEPISALRANKVDKENGKGLSTNDYVTSAKDVVDLADAVIPSDATSNNQLVSVSTMNAAIANVGHFEIASLNNNDEPDVQNPDTKIFYLTRPSTAAATDPYTEWIYTSSSPSNTAWNIIGSTEIDLSGYVQFPATYTANHLITFGSNDTIQDAGVTINDLAGSITGITLNGGSELPVNQKIVNIPLATTATDGLIGSADMGKLDSIAASAQVNVQSDWSETATSSDAFIANKPNVLIPLDSPAAQGGISAPINIMVVTAMPAAGSIDPNTIYLVQGTMIGN